MATGIESVGAQLRQWRQHRRMSQLDLALEAEISSRHLSFVETGRAQPSKAMLLRLADHLGVPLRERNTLLLAAGLAPAYQQRSLDDPTLAHARRAIEMILKGHEPYPALAVDRHWQMIAANASVAPLLEGVSAGLLEAPVNVLRLSLHPEGLAPRIVNLAEWKAHLMKRLDDQIAATADPVLRQLSEELVGYPAMNGSAEDFSGILVPLVLEAPLGRRLSFLSTTTVFGTPIEVTLSEVAIEAFFPADAETTAALREG